MRFNFMGLCSRLGKVDIVFLTDFEFPKQRGVLDSNECAAIGGIMRISVVFVRAAIGIGCLGNGDHFNSFGISGFSKHAFGINVVDDHFGSHFAHMVGALETAVGTGVVLSIGGSAGEFAPCITRLFS